MIEIHSGKAPVSLEWCGCGGKATTTTGSSSSSNSHNLVVTEVNGRISVFDTRQLSASTTSNSSSASAAVCVFDPTGRPKNEVVEATMFSPDGNHLIAAVTRDGMGDLDVWNWKDSSMTDKNSKVAKKRRVLHYPAHTGPIYAMDISPNGSRLATGGWDALVELWDTAIKAPTLTSPSSSSATADDGDDDYFLDSGINNFICTHTIRRRIKFFRTVAFSHDGKLLASSTEEHDVDIAQAATGASVGLVNIACGQQGAVIAAAGVSGNAAASSSLNRRGGGGAEEVAWHPKDYILACARIDSPYGASPLTPVAVAKLNITTT
jgi:WD40 repeat protein